MDKKKELSDETRKRDFEDLLKKLAEYRREMGRKDEQ